MTAPATAAPIPFRRMLLALDTAAHRPRTGLVVAGLVGSTGASLIICHVSMRPTSVAANESDGEPANHEESGVLEQLRSTAVEWFGHAGASTPVKILHGDAGQRICEFARYAQCDLVILEARPDRSFAQRLRGSVTKYVVTNAPGSVLVVGE